MQNKDIDISNIWCHILDWQNNIPYFCAIKSVKFFCETYSDGTINIKSITKSNTHSMEYQ